MRRALIALLAAPSVMLASLVPPGARAQGGAAPVAVVVVRDAEADSLVTGLPHSLLRAVGVDPGVVKVVLVQARPINAFVTTGNRLFINTGLIQQSETVGEPAGLPAHEAGPIAGGPTRPAAPSRRCPPGAGSRRARSASTRTGCAAGRDRSPGGVGRAPGAPPGYEGRRGRRASRRAGWWIGSGG